MCGVIVMSMLGECLKKEMLNTLALWNNLSPHRVYSCHLLEAPTTGVNTHSAIPKAYSLFDF
jgi:hypothetical protein